MIERRARWERALSCTREQLVAEICSSLVILAAGISLRPQLSSALIVLFGLAVGLVTYGCNRFVLALPFLARRVDWENEPRSPSTARYFTAGLFMAFLILLAIAAVYKSIGDAPASLVVFTGGFTLTFALITAAQRFLIERDFARHLPGR